MEEHVEETNKELRLCPQFIVKPTMYVFFYLRVIYVIMFEIVLAKFDRN